MTDLSALSPVEILTLTLIGEARGEPIESQVGVANVIRNRVLARKQSYRSICLQPFQFSCWNDEDPNRALLLTIADDLIAGRALDIPSRLQCLCIARGIVNSEIMDNTKGSLNYLTTKLYESSHRPAWAKSVYYAIAHGNHTFFKINDSSSVKV